MSLAQIAIEKRAVTYFAVFLLVVAGTASFFALGQLEDPEYTVKNAVITTTYPGASPEEVELEVTDRIELAIQELPQLKYVESYSQAGVSTIKVEIKAEYWSDRLPQVWSELRAKVRDVEALLPPGVGRPDISDDFGDVFGFQLALTGDGFSYAEMEKYAKYIRKEVSVVPGVARVDLWGVQDRVIYVDVAQSQLAALGLTDSTIGATLNQQNMVVDAGSVDLQDKRFRIAPTGSFASPEDIGSLTLRPGIRDQFGNLIATADAENEKRRAGSDELIRIENIGTVRSGYREPPFQQMRFNGAPAVGISITNSAGVNVVTVGRAIDQRLDEIIPILPVGIEVHRVHWMSHIVDQSVKGFLVSFAQALGIVLVVLAVFMGVRMGLIIGFALILTILATFILLAVIGIDLQRMSLGALIIALGMMVDNAIVVADGVSVRLQKGMDRTQAAIEAASQPAWPLLAATAIAVMAFYPIYASTEGAGEYCRTLFTVVAIALLASWVISVTVTPLQCLDLLPTPKQVDDDAEPSQGGFYGRFRGFLDAAIRFRFFTIGIMVALLVAAVMGFGNVKQLFFPESSMQKFMVDFWLPEGSRIQDVAAQLEIAEERLMAEERVESVTAYIGAGPPRFYLPVDPEYPYQSYGQLIVNVDDYREVDGLIETLTPWFETTFPNAQVPLRKYGVGPSNTWKFELRISGPAVADPAVLRDLGDQVLAILERSPLVATPRINWRERVQKVVPEYNQERARWSAVTREDVASATQRAFDGRTIGLYREADELIPIVLRHAEEERGKVGGLPTLQVQPAGSTQSVPLAQVTDGILPEWEDPLIWRRDRRRTITVQANPILGVTFPSLQADVIDELAAIELPPGHTIVWGGEHEDTVDAQASLIPGMVPAGIIILFLIVMLFNAFRPLLVLLFTVPFALIGITLGLLVFDVPFGFVALLGAMSLAGMMLKNGIVLLDEINLNLSLGKAPYDAVMDSAASRLRPVALAAATTVLGVIPLLQDAFWIGLSVVIMVGLTFGTLLTMVLLPTFYCTLYRIPAQAKGERPASGALEQPQTT
jgi:multidrug efflux pump subunit AcrB